MAPSSLTGLDPSWMGRADGTVVLANGEDEREVLEALGRAGVPSTPLGTHRCFHWHALKGALLCVAGVGPANVELAVHDARAANAQRIVRFGTCGAIAKDLLMGHVVVANEGLAFHDGIATIGADADEVRTPADMVLLSDLSKALERSGVPGRPGSVVGTPFFHEPPPSGRGRRYQMLLRSGRVDAIDMETGTLLWLGSRLGVNAGSVLGVANRVGDKRLDGPTGLGGAARVVAAWLAARA